MPRPTPLPPHTRHPVAPRTAAALVWLSLALAAPAQAAPPSPAAAPTPRSAPRAKPAVAPVRTAASAAPATPVATQAPPPLRLDAAVQPRAYRLDLTLDPAQPRYQGQVAIDLRLAQATPRIVLHAKGLQIGHAFVESGAHRWPARVGQVDAERIALRPPQPVPAGAARLVLHFSAPLQDKDVYGLFRQQQAGRWYVASQFQAVGARLAFPLFDEPGWKVPWTLSLTVPDGLQALANTPAEPPTPAAPGWQRWQFAPTPPLPSYLLAMAVGPYQLVDAPAQGHTPLRMATPAGRGDEAAHAVQITGPVLARLEQYFGSPHPYAKLDSLVIPVTASFDAMENPGLVTYAAGAMLAKPGHESPAFRLGHVGLVAHELAHQWFGNLVTPAWWDDLWLNESFASWLGDRVTAELLPEHPVEPLMQRARSRAMQADRLASARRVRQPVTQEEDLGNLWDPITYEKGQSVLAMVEAWLGPERFQAGVRRYMDRHAWGLASAEDFFAALAPEDARLPELLRRYVDQPGIPRVQVELLCPPGQAPQALLRQSRLLPLGSPAAAQAAPLWHIPLRLRSPAGEQAVLLTEASAAVPLPDAQCPAWLQANAGGRGYYRSQYAAAPWAALVARASAHHPEALTLGETLALLDDARGLHAAGALDTPGLLALWQSLAGDERPDVLSALADGLRWAQPLFDADAASRQAHVQRWQALLGAPARALGWLPRAGDTPAQRLLRPRLLPAVAGQGQDAALRAQATALARAWLADRGALPAESRPAVLAAAAADGDAELLAALAQALRDSPDEGERHQLFQALGEARSPAAAAQVRALLLAPGIDPREGLWPLLRAQAAAGGEAGRLAALDFIGQHHGALAARVGRDDPAAWPYLFAGGCSADEAERVRQVFAPHAARHLGGALALARALESISLCQAWRAQQAPGAPTAPMARPLS